MPAIKSAPGSIPGAQLGHARHKIDYSNEHKVMFKSQQSHIGSYGHDDPEEFWWGAWLVGAQRQGTKASLSQPVCSKEVKINCRWRAFPWPYSQAAEGVSHEAMHTHGYGHGNGDDNQANKEECGYEGKSDQQWHFQRNTAPYIVGDCMSYVLEHSATVCGVAATESCEDNGLRLVTTLDGNNCECVADTSMAGKKIEKFDGKNDGDAGVKDAPLPGGIPEPARRQRSESSLNVQ
ncbi:MAG: hypothetical protein HY074_16400 [Deltaproteobacteria bacterium]|nr:hypothetical protein [Deltaproteobacteria bacterium]